MTNEVLKTETLPATRRGRKRTDTPNDVLVVARLQAVEDRQYGGALEAPDVKAALFNYEKAQECRDSIGRKLCGGSTAVTVGDLARWEEALSDAKKALAHIARRAPILERHPVFASVVANS